MFREHWDWCRQKIDIQDPILLKLQEEGSLPRVPPCECKLVFKEMPFIRLSWLLSDECQLNNLPPNQELPAKAFIYPNEMKHAYFISHRWLSPSHPDKSGSQIALALPNMRSFVDEERKDPYSCKLTNLTGIWHDYLCLPQGTKTKQQKAMFDKLLMQIPALTLTTTPILVIDDGKDYSNRAWCILEAIGVMRSGLDAWGISKAIQVETYKSVLCDGLSPWDPSANVYREYRAGLSKLKSWAKKNNVDFNLDKNELSRDKRSYVACMVKRNEVALALKYLMDKYNMTDDELLLAIAKQYDLRCTIKGDELICMRLMCDTIKLSFES